MAYGAATRNGSAIARRTAIGLTATVAALSCNRITGQHRTGAVPSVEDAMRPVLACFWTPLIPSRTAWRAIGDSEAQCVHASEASGPLQHRRGSGCDFSSQRC
jgi:hypothetical protein